MSKVNFRGLDTKWGSPDRKRAAATHTITPEAAELRAKLLKDFSPPLRSLEVVRHELKPLFAGFEAWIAGGFAAQPATATDVDVWVVDATDAAQHVDSPHDIMPRLREWGLVEAWAVHDYQPRFSRWQGRLPSGMPLDVVIPNRGEGIRDVLEGFDHPALGVAFNVATGARLYVETEFRHWSASPGSHITKLARLVKVCARHGRPVGRESGFRELLIKVLNIWEAGEPFGVNE